MFAELDKPCHQMAEVNEVQGSWVTDGMTMLTIDGGCFKAVAHSKVCLLYLTSVSSILEIIFPFSRALSTISLNMEARILGLDCGLPHTLLWPSSKIEMVDQQLTVVTLS